MDKLTEAYLPAPSHPKLEHSMCRSPYHQIPLLGYTSTPSPPSTINVSSAHHLKIRTIYLFNLAFPPFFGFMRPFI